MNQYCPACGTKIEGDSKFCTTCGYSLEVQSNNQMNNQVNNQMPVNNGVQPQMQNNYDINNNFTTSAGVQANTNGMAIAGLVISIVSLVLCCGGLSWLSLVFSIIGMNTAKKNNGSGNGLAIAGLIVSIVGMLFMLVWLIPFMIGFTEGLASI